MIIDAPDFPSALNIAKSEILGERGFDEPKNFQEATKVICRALEILIISKNHKYGKKNINDLGDIGIFCRTYDKVSRLREHYIEGKDLGTETALDSWADLCGYAMVGVLKKHNDWYSIPLEE